MIEQYKKNARFAEAVEASGCGLTRSELPEENYLADGVYVRTLKIPAGVTVLGKIHKTEHIFAIVQGIVNISDESGTRQVSAPDFKVSSIGSQRVIYAVTDCMLMNAHHCDTNQSIEEIENHLTTMDYKALPKTGVIN